MQTKVDSGDAAYTVHLNSIIQAQTREGYHVSGGKVTPGSSSSNITVAVDGGQVAINGNNITFTSQDVQLNDGSSDPRVDTVYVNGSGNVAVSSGTPQPYKPNQNPDGNEITPAPFEHWQPAPNSGEDITGVILGFILIEPGMGTSADLPNTHIRQWKIGASRNNEFVRGDGVDNGEVSINTENADFSVEDEERFIHRDISAGELHLGGEESELHFDTSAYLNENTIEDAGGISFAGSNQSLDFDGGFEITDSGNNIISYQNSELSLGNNTLHDVGQVVPNTSNNQEPVIDLEENTSGFNKIWQDNEGDSSGSTFSVISDLNAGRVLKVRDETQPINLFSVYQNGDIRILGDSLGASSYRFEQSDIARVAYDNGDLVYFDGQANKYTIKEGEDE